MNATMIESATGNEENASTHTKVSRRKYDIKFINTDKYFKYGLGFSGQVFFSILYWEYYPFKHLINLMLLRFK